MIQCRLTPREHIFPSFPFAVGDYERKFMLLCSFFSVSRAVIWQIDGDGLSSLTRTHEKCGWDTIVSPSPPFFRLFPSWLKKKKVPTSSSNGGLRCVCSPSERRRCVTVPRDWFNVQRLCFYFHVHKCYAVLQPSEPGDSSISAVLSLIDDGDLINNPRFHGNHFLMFLGRVWMNLIMSGAVRLFGNQSGAVH